jgi:tRNA(Ile)-lysidine synthase
MKESDYQLPTTNYQLENTIAAALKNCPLETVFLAAVSGGADSTAMLVALAAIACGAIGRDSFPHYQLFCVHVEHGIRPAEESRGDAEFTRSLCEKFRVPCRIVSVPPGKIEAVAKSRGTGIEAAARHFRRRILIREARRIEAETGRPVLILTAHTKDDMLETVLMRILRGSGPAGLSAMSAQNGRFFRPMLELSRRDVLGYLSEKNITWREDSTNADTRFFRNRVRHRLIPLLNESFPHWRTAVTSLAETQSLTADFIKEEAARRIIWGSPAALSAGTRDQGLGNDYLVVQHPLSTTPDPHSLSTDAETFFSQPPVIREEALFQAIDTLPAASKLYSTVKRSNIRRFCEGNITAVDLGPFQLRKNSQEITISPSTNYQPPTTNSESGFSLLINAPGLYNLKEVTIEVTPCCQKREKTAEGFYAFLPLVLRPVLKGTICAEDRFGVAAFIGSGGLTAGKGDASARRSKAADVFCTVHPTV